MKASWAQWFVVWRRSWKARTPGAEPLTITLDEVQLDGNMTCMFPCRDAGAWYVALRSSEIR